MDGKIRSYSACMSKDWKTISLKLAGDVCDFIYDVKEDRIYPRMFPGIDVEPFTTSCGVRIKPDFLKKVLVEKIAIFEIEMQNALKEQKLDFENLF